MQKLLDRVDFGKNEDDWLYILGDVIDRSNSGGIDILKWLLVAKNAELLLGNHEQMLLDCRWVFNEINDETVGAIKPRDIEAYERWQLNGGECTLAALSKETPETRSEILEYLEGCLLYESVMVNGRAYVLVHAGLGNFSPDKKLKDYTESELLWARPDMDTVYAPDKYTVVLGHTPTGYYSCEFRNRMIKTDSWWDIDTGASSKSGRPMLLCLDNGNQYYIEDDGNVLEI